MKYLIEGNINDPNSLKFLNEDGEFDDTKPYYTYEGNNINIIYHVEKGFSFRSISEHLSSYMKTKNTISLHICSVEKEYISFLESTDKTTQEMGLSLLLKEKYNIIT